MCRKLLLFFVVVTYLLVFGSSSAPTAETIGVVCHYSCMNYSILCSASKSSQ